MRCAVLLMLIACNGPQPVTPEPSFGFGLPLPERQAFHLVVGVDHDPEDYGSGVEASNCINYAGEPFPFCYDGHDGTDFLLKGGFDTMDAGSSPIVAAADGTVVEVADGNYDRCHADLELGSNSCDGYPMEANYVIVEHDNGMRSLYWHMKRDSVSVAVGDTVTCGDPLGLVGSSGNSSTPHLHFEVRLATGSVVDPYAGPYSQEHSWWTEQVTGLDSLPGPGCAE